MAIFGSSNWTSPSAEAQLEHNIFTTKPGLFDWFVDQFERKWNNTGGIAKRRLRAAAAGRAESRRRPTARPAEHHATLTWYGGPWAHLYDVGVIATNSAFTGAIPIPNIRLRHRRRPRSARSATRCPPPCSSPGDDLLLESRRQDDGAENEVERGVDSSPPPERPSAAPAHRQRVTSCSTPRRRR